MINPSELRIGNVILFNNQPIIVRGIKEVGVMLEGVMFQTGDPLRPYDYQLIYAEDQRISPLLLNNRLLDLVMRRYRVNGVIVYNYHAHNGGTFFVKNEGMGLFVGMYNGDNLIHITPHSFRYYHQLQNIHFAQFGEELNVDFDELVGYWNLINQNAR